MDSPLKQPSSPFRTFLTVAGLVALLSWISVVPPGTELGVGSKTNSDELAPEDLTAADSSNPNGPGANDPSARADVNNPNNPNNPRNKRAATAGSIDCAKRKNGGATDTGVTAGKIRLASTAVLDGDGSSFLKDSPTAMNAIKLRVNNREGGICGRILELDIRNDAWVAARGRDYIQDFIHQGYFALPVVPSSEGLSSAIEASVIDKGAIPVVGTDGMRKEQYDAKGKASWVWPVAVATIAQVRIMTKYAYDKGARTFGIVYDSRYKFGVEGADAYECYVTGKVEDTGQRCSANLGATLKRRQPIEPSQTTYPVAQDFTKPENCGPCDLVVLLLEPETGKTWMTSAGPPGKGGVMTGAAQPLFNDNFARGCGEVCNEVFAWTGYNPAIGPNVNRPEFDDYIKDVRAVDPSVDITNQFMQGAYLGMKVFVQALKICSPLGLTRACVKQKMDSPQMDYTSEFVTTMRWRGGNHFANGCARAYSITYSLGSFSGFRDKQTGCVSDPTPGVVPVDR